MAANLLASPSDFGTASWTPAFCVPTGTSVDDTSGAGVGSVLQDVTVPADTNNYVFSALIPKTVGATIFPALDVRFGAAVTAIVVNTDAGTLTPRTGWDPTGSGIASRGANWLVWIYNTNTSQTTMSVRYEPAFNGDASGSPDVTKTGATIFANARFELGTTPTESSPGPGFFSG